MNDMKQVIIPKSDQLNADDLISGPMTITITRVDIRGGQEQPVSIHFEGDNGKPYKACKSMCRVMVSVWGPNSKAYVGRSMTLYRDPSVKWGGMEVGGIRISHMSDLQENMTMALTMTRSNRKPFTVKPLAKVQVKEVIESAPDEPDAYITADDLQAILLTVERKGIKGRFDTKLATSKIAAPDKIPLGKVAAIKAWVEAASGAA